MTEGVRRGGTRSAATKIARTRQAVFDAVEEIPAGEPVTVAEVVRRAGISRAAFYTHFTGLEELALAIMHEMVARISALDHEARRQGGASWRATSIAALTRNIEHIVRHRGLYLGVIGMPGSSSAFDAAVTEFAAAIAATVVHLPDPPGEPLLGDSSRFIASGTISTVMHWLRTDPEMTVEQMVARLEPLLPDWDG